MSGQLASRLGYYKVLIMIGLCLMMGGFFLLSTLNADTPYARVILYMIVLGLGIGPALPLFNLAIQNAVKPWEIGVATSSGQFFQQMGSTIGTAVFGAILSASLAPNIASNLKTAETGQPAAIVAQLESTRQKITSASGASANASRSGSTGPTFETVSGQITAGIDKQFAAIATAVKSGNPATFSAVINNPALPAQMREGLGRIPAQAIQSPQGQQQVLTTLKTFQTAATTAALKTAKTTFDLTTRATKVAFASTVSRIYLISIFVALLALLAVLPMPNLRMPRKGEGGGGERPSAMAAMEG